ncbi:MAG: tetrahydrofolate dehydrogenase/cyclohydrolase catalytic domain-containing protein, partial [bacterium]
MRCKLLDGKEPAEKLELELKEELNNFEKKPVLLSLSIGKDAAKDSYIKSKMRLASKLGIGFEFVEF